MPSAACWRPCVKTYWMTSRRSCSKSTPMSGGSLRSRESSSNSRLVLVRVQLGDAEAKHTAELPRRAAALAKDFLALGEGDDVLHGEEIAFIAQFGDQLEFFSICFATLALAPFGQRLAMPLFGEMAEP